LGSASRASCRLRPASALTPASGAVASERRLSVVGGSSTDAGADGPEDFASESEAESAGGAPSILPFTADPSSRARSLRSTHGRDRAHPLGQPRVDRFWCVALACTSIGSGCRHVDVTGGASFARPGAPEREDGHECAKSVYTPSLCQAKASKETIDGSRDQSFMPDHALGRASLRNRSLPVAASLGAARRRPSRVFPLVFRPPSRPLARCPATLRGRPGRIHVAGPVCSAIVLAAPRSLSAHLAVDWEGEEAPTGRPVAPPTIGELPLSMPHPPHPDERSVSA